MCYPLLIGTVALAVTRYWPLALPVAVVLGLIVYFFRDPPRRIPQEPGLMVSPADGKVVEILELPHDEFIGGPAVRIGLFLSIFNVHLNRVPCDTRVLSLRYSPGKFLMHCGPKSARERGHVDWPGRHWTDAAAFGRAADCGAVCPSHRLRPAAGGRTSARKAVWHD